MSLRDFNFMGDLIISNFEVETNCSTDRYKNLENQLMVLIYSIIGYDETYFNFIKNKRITNKSFLEKEIKKQLLLDIKSKYPLEEIISLINLEVIILNNTLHLYFYYFNNDIQKNKLIFDKQINL